MTIPRVERVATKRTIDLKRLDHVGKEFLVEAIAEEMASFGLEENRNQARRNPPNWASQIILDRRHPFNLTPAESKQLARAKNVSFAGLKRNLRFVYTNTTDLGKAVTMALSSLKALTQRGKTGGAVNSYRMYGVDWGGRRGNLDSKSVRKMLSWVAGASSDNISIEIQGPTSSDRRKRIYLEGKNSKQKSKWVSPSKSYNDQYKRDIPKAIDRYKFLRPKERRMAKNLYSNKATTTGAGTVLRRNKNRTYSAGVAQAIHETVLRQVRRQYRNIGVSYGFKPIKKNPRDPRRDTDTKAKYGEYGPVLSFRPKRAYRGYRPR